ncbi:MAG TPA: polyribonucleotide nucleotidyltransferase, partial [Sumerlaeia bacterium]|nr:polyribonucleotide nucleotidyltransferase [Sumerlaeia bacterium]
MIHTVTIPFGEDRELVLETGRVAGQAAGSVLAKIGGTVVMANVVHSKEPSEQLDFFPLMVDYREKHYATGRIPGNFFRREGRPGTPETINARLIDRTIRPLFPKGFKYEVQVFLTVLSMDQINPPAIPALIAASAAISISDLPFAGPVGAARIGRVAERFVVNPTFAQRDEGDLDVVAAGTRSAINMVESGSKGVSEQVILDALRRGHDEIATVVERIDRLVAECGRAKMTFEPREPDPETVGAVEEEIRGRFTSIDAIREKPEREAALRALREGTIEKLIERFVPEAGGETETAKKRKDMGEVFDQAYRQHVRTRVVG